MLFIGAAGALNPQEIQIRQENILVASAQKISSFRIYNADSINFNINNISMSSIDDRRR